MDQNSYLKSEHVIGFTNFIAGLIRRRGDLNHQYTIKHRIWLKYLGDRIGRDHKFEIHTFKDALESYFWVVNDKVSGEEEDSDEQEAQTVELEPEGNLSKKDFESNHEALRSLANLLNMALREKSEEKTFIAATRVLEWGQVYRGSIQWLISKYDQGKLVHSINDAVDVLTCDNAKDCLKRFDHRDLRMDSGTTKIFSLASGGRSIIYDDRVGAALGLLVIRYLNSIPTERRPTSVPEELRFMRSDKKGRNPSNELYRFPRRGKYPSQVHALSNLRANWIIHSLAEEFSGEWDPRKLEAALFMIGYRV